jgi:hypothetical protein
MVFSLPALDVLVLSHEGCIAQGTALRSAVRQIWTAVDHHKMPPSPGKKQGLHDMTFGKVKYSPALEF